ncbi:MAG: YicC family protein [Clostridiales bacterium]|uniref:YicC family protein n=1 Tax=Candidatus Anaerobutyricum stercoripullorum TaxID=2838456 RepID=A0A9D2BDR8_9FIRM|nr:YicC family protein [Clostridiales bacterium]HIX72328.1 YicC family protein [Candidatus Anaerobutyricum stercoripullorum]
MIKSMTGFGRSEMVTEQCKITVEIKAVNHRYCDLNIKMPKKLNILENAVRGAIKKAVHRGKLDVYIGYEDLSEHAACVQLNKELGREYYRALSELSEELGIDNDASAVRIARMPEVLMLSEAQLVPEEVEETLLLAVGQALSQFMESRVREGEQLKEDILRKLHGMTGNISAIEERYPQMVSDYRKKLTDKVKELLADSNVDESRIATEVVIYADKICVDEETVRLRSHITNMEEELTRGGNVGRKLDFIAQEMNREANTILSKANDITVSNMAIDLKTEIEKIREQVQNIE